MKKYQVIYADPPWNYDNKNVQGSQDVQYNGMTINEMKSMPINNMTDDDSVCFIWVTNSFLTDGLEILSAWGFKYKTILTWKKSGLWLGYWFRNVTEHILVGTKGNPKAFHCQKSNFFECKPGKHSQKPHYFRELISSAVVNSFDNPNKLELFARSRDGMFSDMEYEGWDVYGNQVTNSITLTEV